jgi:hypothetical protein
MDVTKALYYHAKRDLRPMNDTNLTQSYINFKQKASAYGRGFVSRVLKT